MYEPDILLIADDLSYDGSFIDAINSAKNSSDFTVIISNLEWDIAFEDVMDVIEGKSNAEVADFFGISQKKYSEMSQENRENFIEDRINNYLDEDKLYKFFRIPKEVILSVKNKDLINGIKTNKYCEDVCDFLSDEYAMLLNDFSTEILSMNKNKENIIR